jgi:lysophospholipase L1-like esterase
MRTIRLPACLIAAALLSHSQATSRWAGSWACSQQVPEPANALPPDDLSGGTLVQIVHLSLGGGSIRVRLSNAFGTAPLHLLAVNVARPVSNAAPEVQPGSERRLQFSGRTDVTIPAGAEYLSDPLNYPVGGGSDLSVSIRYGDPPAGETGHPGSRATSFLVWPGMAEPKKFEHWYQLSGVDVLPDGNASSVVALGDSITDGHGATTNGNDRWTDVLARRLQTAGIRDTGVLNEGIGGNHLLTDGLGPNALARFDRDVLAQTAVRTVIVLEGVNDLGALARKGSATPAEHADLVRRIEAAYEQMIERAHAHRLRIIGATITPFAGSNYYHPDAASEADRREVNAWIREPNHFDAVADFDQVMRDPAHPDRLLPAYDSGDHLHPSPAGYAAMADAVPLHLVVAERAQSADPTPQSSQREDVIWLQLRRQALSSNP